MESAINFGIKMNMKLEKSWHERLEQEIRKPYVQTLKDFLVREKLNNAIVYPPEAQVFHAFAKTPFEKVKVVIMGQDPYHGRGQAHGLSFSVPETVAIPPSLKNIYKELKNDLGLEPPRIGCLVSWAMQGVLLLNATLTVREGEPRAHYGKGWEQFTDAVIEILAQRDDPLVFILWGKAAQEKCLHLLNLKKNPHLILTAAHPSPYSATKFLGCRHFSKTNAFLEKVGKRPINWEIK